MTEKTAVNPEAQWLQEDMNIGSSRRTALIDDETRLKFLISDITVIGNVEFKQPNGQVNVSYQFGIGFTSNRKQKFEDTGEPTGRFVSFFIPFTVTSFSPKSNIIKSGLLDAVKYDQNQTTTNQLIAGLIGKQVSGMISHRTYTKDGKEGIAMELGKFKPVTEEDDFSEALAVWKPHFLARRFGEKRVITLSDVKNNTAPKAVSFYLTDSDAPTKKGVIDLD